MKNIVILSTTLKDLLDLELLFLFAFKPLRLEAFTP
jgi:hypothetical protein